MSSVWGVFFQEVLGTFLLAHIFGVIALYNSGIDRNFVRPADLPEGFSEYYYSMSETSAFPPWLQSVVVFIGLFLVYRIGSRWAKRHLHLNPFISTVVVAQDYTDDKNENSTFFFSLMSLLWLWFSQLLGTALGAALVYALASDNSMTGISQFLGGNGDTTSTQYHLAALVEVGIGTLGLMTVATFSKQYTTGERKEGTEQRKCNFENWALSVSGFYFFYMLFFWTHSKATVDFIRTGMYCLFTEVDSTSANCSRAGNLIDVDAGLYLWCLIFQVLIIVLVLIIAAIVKNYFSQNEMYNELKKKLAPSKAMFRQKMKQ